MPMARRDPQRTAIETPRDRVFEHGVTVGCAPDDDANRRFCPHAPSTRTQISAFLYRYTGASHAPEAVFSPVLRLSSTRRWCRAAPPQAPPTRHRWWRCWRRPPGRGVRWCVHATAPTLAGGSLWAGRLSPVVQWHGSLRCGGEQGWLGWCLALGAAAAWAQPHAFGGGVGGLSPTVATCPPGGWRGADGEFSQGWPSLGC